MLKILFAHADLAWLCCVGQRGTHSSPPRRRPGLDRINTATGQRSAARSSRGPGHRVRIPWRATRALFALWRIGRPPTEHVPSSADVARLCCGTTWSTLLPTPSAGARPHQHCNRSAARRSRGPGHFVRRLWRASRALFAPWRNGRPPTEHVRAGRLGVVVLWANTEHVYPHAVGWGSTAPTS